MRNKTLPPPLRVKLNEMVRPLARADVGMPAGRLRRRQPDTVAWRDFLKRLMCRHKRGPLLWIEWDGTSICECSGCGKQIRKPLS